MKPYLRQINYHETDKMSVVHHSNYVKFMEEARVEYLNQADLQYTIFEADGLLSPVLSVEVEYKHPARFGDTLSIAVSMEKYTGTRIAFRYEMRNQHDQLVCFAHSAHCFLFENRVCALQHGFEKYHLKLQRAFEKDHA